MKTLQEHTDEELLDELQQRAVKSDRGFVAVMNGTEGFNFDRYNDSIFAYGACGRIMTKIKSRWSDGEDEV